MAVKRDTVQVRVEIDGKQSLNELGALEAQAAEIKSTLKDGANAAREFEKATAQLAKAEPGTKQYQKAAEAIERTRDAANKYYDDTKKLEGINNRIGELRKEVGLAALSMRQLTARQRDLNREIAGITPGTDRYKELSKELIEVNQLLAKQKAELRGAIEEAGKGPSIFAQFGRAGLALGGIGAAIGALGGVAAEIGAIEKEFNTLQKTIARTAQISAEEAGQAVADIQALANVFGQETSDILQSANALAKQTNISFNESLQLIEQGFLAGADANGDFLEIIKEYPVQFKNAGFSAKEFIQIATQQARSGIFGDKLLDSIKETDLALKELGKAQKDALAPLGAEFVRNLEAGLAAGTISTKEALLSIQAQAKAAGLNFQQLQAITADVFKGAGEDAGGFAVVLQNVNEGLQINLDTLDLLALEQQKAVETEKAYNAALLETAQLFTGASASAGNFFTQIKTAGVNAFNDLFKAIARTGILGQAGKFSAQVIELKARGLEQLEKDLGGVEQKLADVGKAQALYNMFVKEGTIERDTDKEEAFQSRLNKLLEERQFLEAAISESKKDTLQAEQKTAATVEKTSARQPVATKTTQTKDDKQAAKLLADWQELQRKITEIQQENQDARLDAIGLEVKAIDMQFEALLNQAEKLRQEDLQQKGLTAAQKLEIEQRYLDKTEQINAAHNEALRLFEKEKNNKFKVDKKAFIDEINTLNKEGQVAEIDAVNSYYDDLKKQAEKFGLDTVAIEALRARALKEIQEKSNAATLEADKKLWAARAQVLNQFGNLVAETVNFLGAIGVENTKFQKGLAVAQIAIDTAASLAGIIPLAIEASTATGPAAPFVFAGYIASMTAVVLGGVAAAYKALSKAKEPSAPAAIEAPISRGFAGGGYTGNGLGFKDESGYNVAGIVHSNEYVIPARLLRLQPVAQMAATIEAMRTGQAVAAQNFQEGGFTTNANAPVFMADNKELLASLANINALLQRLQAGIKAYVVYSEIKDAEEQINFIDDQTKL